MSLEDALSLSVPKPDQFELLIATGTDGRHWYLAMEYWRTGRMIHAWDRDGRCFPFREVRAAPAAVDWAPGYLRPLVEESAPPPR